MNTKRALLIAIPVIIVAIGATYYLMGGEREPVQPNDSATNIEPEPKNTDEKAVTWQFDGQRWQPSNTPPECDEPLVLQTPVDISKVTAILYPGQTRGQYKPHGGFRFDGAPNEITVTAPYDAIVTQASRYIEGGEVQYLFEFVNECGIAYRFDHLLTLSDKFQALAEQLPAAKADDSRTTRLSPVAVTAGETIATAIGFATTKNVTVDFGVYNLRTPNKASENAAYKAAHTNQSSLAYYGVCWLDLLPTDDKLTAKALPGGDGQVGKQSDYCE